MARSKRAEAVAIEDRPDYPVLARRCRHFGWPPTHQNITRARDPRLATVAGRMSFHSLISVAQFNAAEDAAGIAELWRRRKGLPRAAVSNTFWQECQSGIWDVEGVSPLRVLDAEESLERIERARAGVFTALHGCGRDVMYSTVSLINESLPDHRFYREVAGVRYRTAFGEMARTGLRALCEYFLLDDDDAGA